MKTSAKKIEIKAHYPSLRLEFNHFAPGLPWHIMTAHGKSNCYAYALNLPESKWATPGDLRKGGNILGEDDDLTPHDIKTALEKDGLEEISATEALSGQFHAIACRLRPYSPYSAHPAADFHFLRLDHKTGTWSHKPGPRPPDNFDENGRTIENPEKANFHEYEIFCGYYAIPDDGILYTPQLDTYDL